MSMHEFTRLLELSTTAPRPQAAPADERFEKTLETFAIDLAETMLQNRVVIRKAAEAVAEIERYK